MGKFMKPGKVVMVLAGRYAGRKAVIVKVRLETLIMCMILLYLDLNYRSPVLPPQRVFTKIEI